MSGGHFDYAQDRIGYIADEIERIISVNDNIEKDQYGDDVGYHFPQDIIDKFKDAVKTLKIAEAMVQKIDWLVSGDDGEDSFRERWGKEVMKDFL
ncbi:MAG: hypothetical protein Q8N95_05530 [Desulfobacterales bacterium]|nr:hypothetical protein [Desulfobacterales bacterium]